MTPPTPEELLRLARKAWPDEAQLHVLDDEDDRVVIDDGYGIDQAKIQYHPRNREAMHAALLVLSGELDVAALLEKARQLCQHASDMATSYATSAADSFDGPEGHIGYYLKGQRDILGIYADSFRKLLPKEDP